MSIVNVLAAPLERVHVTPRFSTQRRKEKERVGALPCRRVIASRAGRALPAGTRREEVNPFSFS